MTVNSRTKGRVAFSYFDAIKSSRWVYLDFRSVHKSASAPNNLFKVDNNVELLSNVKKEHYYLVAAKILYLS